jgi:DNA repair photolyase
MKVALKKVKTILTPSGLPTPDFVLNPYGGCAFGCVYCYADFTRRFQGHTEDKWGEYVDVRVNAAEVLDKEIKSLIKNIKNRNHKPWKNEKYPIVLLSSVVDPYQGVESKYKITRQCLEVLVKNKFPGEVSILTKSPLVVRDLDLLEKLNTNPLDPPYLAETRDFVQGEVEVGNSSLTREGRVGLYLYPSSISIGMTITSTDDGVSRLLEKNAPPASERLKALKQINDAGFKTYVCVNPLLPHFADNREELEKLFHAIEDAGTHEVFIEHLNLSGSKRKRLFEELKDKIDTEVLEKFWFSQSDEYKEKLEKMIWDILKDTKLKVLGGGIIDHDRLMKEGVKFVFKKQQTPQDMLL